MTIRQKIMLSFAMLQLSLVMGMDMFAVVNANTSVDVPITLVPPGVTLPGTACDQGPNAASIPRAAAAVGFTHCALNADFTTSTTDGNGINWSNPATWLNECGATAPWRFYAAFTQSGIYCPRFTIVLDGGTNVLHMLFKYPDDQGLDSNANTWLNLTWPCGFGRTVLAGGCLPVPYYTEITFRMPLSSLNIGGPTDTFNFFAGPGLSAPNGNYLEPDFLEVGSNSNSGSGWQFGDGTIEWINNATGPGLGQMSGKADLTVYHTIGTLMTQDGSNFAKCSWLDGSPLGCASFATTNPVDLTRESYSLLLWLGGHNSFVTNNIEAFIRSIRLWACPNYKTSTCQTSIVTSQ